MNAKEAAELLDGSQYRKEGSRELFDQMRNNRLVAMFGASDDLVEYRGAIDDEEGGERIHYLDKNGIVYNDCKEHDCPYFIEHRDKTSKSVESFYYKEDDCGWTFETHIPHKTFRVFEDGELYCRGIVFSLDDL